MTGPPPERARASDLDELPSPGRLEAFSDGVIAIAITLLVLDLHVPELTGTASLADALRAQWPAYFGYGTSFATIGIMWVNHHSLFDRVARVTRTLLFLNLALLLGIATFPFTTSLAARWLREGSDGRLAVALYCASSLVISGTFTALWTYLTRAPWLLRSGDAAVARSARRRSVVGPVAYAGATVIAVVSPIAGFAGCAAIAAWFVRPHRPRR
jgi:uncharacterized membrane protein